MFRKFTTALAIVAVLALAGCSGVSSPSGDMDEHHVSFQGI